MKNAVRSLLPQGIVVLIRAVRRPWVHLLLRRSLSTKVFSAFVHDRNRFAAHSAACRLLQGKRGTKLNEEQLSAIMTVDYHRLEKALSLPDPKPGFGKDAAKRLCSNVELYISLFGYKDICELCVTALEHHHEFNQAQGEGSEDVAKWIEAIRESHERKDVVDGISRGTFQTSRAKIQAEGQIDLSGFFRSRHSIRNYTDQPVAQDDICRAILLAVRSPSVCNRQSARAYVVQGKEDCQAVLALQNGNRGFGHTLQTILIITSDLQCFASVEERNQCWIDGGLFSMSLIYALHSQGLGTCCLNWCATTENDRRLHLLANIPESEAIIMMVAVGHIAENINVARSARRPIQQIMKTCRIISKPL
jgi:nitroreductase